ncbi:MAG: hypothetical protein NXI12_05520 [Alphaproteobacteria bacterium]|nr:hypothetical protein [Alphaproteobacteria bacterium]
MLAAWISYELRPETRALRETDRRCAPWDETPFEVYRAAYEAGDPSAAQCRLARERWGELASGHPNGPGSWIMQGYWIWRVTGEAVPEALEAAAQRSRSNVISLTHSMAAMRGGPDYHSYDNDGCEVLDDVQRELVRVAQADARTDRCLVNWGVEPGVAPG